jgi:predicted NAD/FAD-binding protein
MDGVSIELENRSIMKYDHVVLAIHANQALTLLGNDATAAQREILGVFKTSRNTCHLHEDTSVR